MLKKVTFLLVLFRTLVFFVGFFLEKKLFFVGVETYFYFLYREILLFANRDCEFGANDNRDGIREAFIYPRKG